MSFTGLSRRRLTPQERAEEKAQAEATQRAAEKRKQAQIRERGEREQAARMAWGARRAELRAELAAARAECSHVRSQLTSDDRAVLRHATAELPVVQLLEARAAAALKDHERSEPGALFRR